MDMDLNAASPQAGDDPGIIEIAAGLLIQPPEGPEMEFRTHSRGSTATSGPSNDRPGQMGFVQRDLQAVERPCHPPPARRPGSGAQSPEDFTAQELRRRVDTGQSGTSSRLR